MPTKSIAELEEMVGRSAVTVEGLVVEAGKVAEFARALRDNDPVHQSETAATERGHHAIPAPLTFLRTASFPRYRPEDVDKMRPFDIGFIHGRTLHASHEYEFERPVYVGDELTGKITLVDVYQRKNANKERLTFVAFETKYRDQDDDLVATERHTVVETPEINDDD